MRKTVILLALAILLGSVPAFANAEDEKYFPQTMEEARLHVNQEFAEKFMPDYPELYPHTKDFKSPIGKKLSLRPATWNDHQALSYGEPFGTYNQSKKQYGDLGYNPNGIEFPNPDYPADHEATTMLNKWDWIQYPWNDFGLDIYSLADKTLEDRAELREKIIAGIKQNYPGLFEPGSTHWEEYVLVVQASTRYTWGYGRMWHRWDSNGDGAKENWYTTIPLRPDIIHRITDIEVTGITNACPVETGSKQYAAATFQNNGNMTEEFQVNYYVEDTIANTATISLEPGEIQEDGFEWTAPSAAGTVTLKAEAVPLPQEKDITNNIETTNVNITGPAPVTCPEKSKVTGSWNVTYTWKIKKTRQSRAFSDD